MDNSKRDERTICNTLIHSLRLRHFEFLCCCLSTYCCGLRRLPGGGRCRSHGCAAVSRMDLERSGEC